jgi:hypothetical protein
VVLFCGKRQFLKMAKNHEVFSFVDGSPFF